MPREEGENFVQQVRLADPADAIDPRIHLRSQKKKARETLTTQLRLKSKINATKIRFASVQASEGDSLDNKVELKDHEPDPSIDSILRNTILSAYAAKI